MGLKQEIIQLEEVLSELTVKMREIRMKVDSLEKQNLKLRERLSEERIAGEGEVALRSLYEEGYHICAPHFGEPREDGGCLFCTALLPDGSQK